MNKSFHIRRVYHIFLHKSVVYVSLKLIVSVRFKLVNWHVESYLCLVEGNMNITRLRNCSYQTFKSKNHMKFYQISIFIISSSLFCILRVHKFFHYSLIHINCNFIINNFNFVMTTLSWQITSYIYVIFKYANLQMYTCHSN